MTTFVALLVFPDLDTFSAFSDAASNEGVMKLASPASIVDSELAEI